MDDAEAFELIDAHLDRQPLTDEQSDALTAWIKADPKRADEAFYRIFLHSYLRSRLQAGLLTPTSELSVHRQLSFDPASQDLALALAIEDRSGSSRKRSVWRVIGFLFCLLIVAGLGVAGWKRSFAIFPFSDPGNQLYAYEGFDYPATILPHQNDETFKWPTTGGLQDLNGGSGWSEAWLETESKVAVIVDYAQKEEHWEEKDMRKFGPLGYSDAHGNVLPSSGHQMRTAISPRSISVRRFDINAFPESMRDETGLGRDGSVLWFSFLAQSSLSSAEHNRYSYLLIGSKTTAGLRVGKLGASPSGNWTAVGLQTGAEVNLRSSTFPSGEMVFMVTRVVFRPGPEEAVVWINPSLDAEPRVSDASLRLPVPDFRFDGISINANHSTDFDEIRFGGTFQSVAPTR